MVDGYRLLTIITTIRFYCYLVTLRLRWEYSLYLLRYYVGPVKHLFAKIKRYVSNLKTTYFHLEKIEK